MLISGTNLQLNAQKKKRKSFKGPSPPTSLKSNRCRNLVPNQYLLPNWWQTNMYENSE